MIPHPRRESPLRHRLPALGILLALGLQATALAAPMAIDRIENEIVLHGRRNNQAWFEPAIGMIPGEAGRPPQVFIRATYLTGNDVGPQFYLKTDNLGKTWTNPILCQNWRKEPQEENVFEEPWFGFLYHRKTGTFLALAVQGKLVPQDPNDESASRVLERIDATPKRAMRTRATEEDEGGEPTELEPLFELPPGWEWAPFRRLPLQASVGIDRGRSMQGPDKAVGYFKMNNIRNSGGVDLSDLTRIDATPDDIEAFALADGDFLFNTRNSRELVGKTCVFRAPSDDPILYNNNILRVKFIEGFSPDFLDYWFRSPEGSAELEKLKFNTTNVCAIYQGKLSGFPCVVPPLAEQRRIVAKVEQLMALVDTLETQLAASRSTATNLLSALVAELTGTPHNGKVSVPTASTTGRRGRPRKL